MVWSRYLPLVLGNSYRDTASLIQTLSIIIILHSITFGMASVIVATNQQTNRSRIQFMAVLTNVGTNLIITPKLGLQGAAIAYIMSEVILLLGYSTIVYQTSKQTRHKIAKTLSTETPSILVINIHSHLNLGDEALTHLTVKIIRDHFPDSKITLAFNDKSSYHGLEQTVDSFLSWVKTQNGYVAYRLAAAILVCILPVLTFRIFQVPLLLFVPKYLHPVFKAYCQSDIIISSPGGYFYSFSKGGDFLIIIFSTLLSIFLKKPLYLFPQSFGPLNFWRERVLLKWLVNKANVVMVREVTSMSYLENLKVRQKHLYLFPDLAFGFQGFSDIKAQKYFRSKNIDTTSSPFLGITVMDWGKQNKKFKIQKNYELAITEMIKYFIDEYRGNVVFFPQCYGPSEGEDDRVLAARIVADLGDYKSNVVVITEPLNSRLMKSLFGQMTLFLGTRMHSNIFALSEGVPSIIIGYLHKSEGMAKTIGMQDWVINIHQITSELLISKITHLWIQKEKIRSQLNIEMPKILTQISETGITFEKYAKQYLFGEKYA